MDELDWLEDLDFDLWQDCDELMLLLAGWFEFMEA